jgi:hypothetical protein
MILAIKSSTWVPRKMILSMINLEKHVNFPEIGRSFFDDGPCHVFHESAVLVKCVAADTSIRARRIF